MARSFCVSKKAMEYRLVNLGLIASPDDDSWAIGSHWRRADEQLECLTSSIDLRQLLTGRMESRCNLSSVFWRSDDSEHDTSQTLQTRESSQSSSSRADRLFCMFSEKHVQKILRKDA